jgi:predicted MPP superfamily phosphohydrolase
MERGQLFFGRGFVTPLKSRASSAKGSCGQIIFSILFDAKWGRGLYSLGIRGFKRYLQFGISAEAEWLEVNEPTLELVKNGEEVRLLHLSDFHASPVVSLEYIARAVELGLSLKPDLICLTGDFITSRYEKFSDYARILSPLGKSAPTFACLGNHDGGSWIARGHRGYEDWGLVGAMLKSAQVSILHNRSEVVEVRGRKVQGKRI